MSCRNHCSPGQSVHLKKARCISGVEWRYREKGTCWDMIIKLLRVCGGLDMSKDLVFPPFALPALMTLYPVSCFDVILDNFEIANDDPFLI